MTTELALIAQVETALVEEEGEILHAYTDHLGYWTIGVGRLIDKRKGGGISRIESRYLLDHDIRGRLSMLRARFPWFEQLNLARQSVLLQMAFQMGVDGVAGFHRTLAAMERGDHDAAARGMVNSKWGRVDTPARAARMAAQWKSGELLA